MSIITNKIGTLEYLTAEAISVPHSFTTRLGGVSTGSLASLNLGMHRGDDPANVAENFRRLGAVLGFSAEDLVLTRQTHSDIVRRLGRADCAGIDHREYPECGALITNEPRETLTMCTPDCTPLPLHAPVTAAVGAAHAGWLGTAKAIGAKTVAAMVREFGCQPENIRAAIGPNIAQCHFETGVDVPEAMLDTFGDAADPFIRPAGEKYYVNLRELNALSLRMAGVKRIEVSDACTVCQSDRFWSHRVTRGDRGSQGALIRCMEGSK